MAHAGIGAGATDELSVAPVPVCASPLAMTLPAGIAAPAGAATASVASPRSAAALIGFMASSRRP